MPSIVPHAIQITCPQCGHMFHTNIHMLIDVTQQPELKHALLAGQINMAACPSCGFTSLIATPLIYHDAAKQLFLVHIPPEIVLNAEEQEHIVGESTRAILEQLPSNAPRGYLLTPRHIISLASFVDAILEADGIPREMLEQQHRVIDFISMLAESVNNEEQLKQLVKTHKDELTPDFFTTLASFIAAAKQEQQHDSVQLLSALRAKLTSLLDMTLPDDDEEEAVDIDALLTTLEHAADEDLEEHIIEMRPAIDYVFFQRWTERIEQREQAGAVAEAKQLYARRARVLEIVERIDKQAQEILERSSQLLHEAFAHNDPTAYLTEHSDLITEGFMMVLSANVDAAQRAGDNDAIERFNVIANCVFEIIQAKLPPEERFINELMMAETTQESTAILRNNASLVTTNLVKRMNELAEQQEQRHANDQAKRLRQLAREAGAMLF